MLSAAHAGVWPGRYQNLTWRWLASLSASVGILNQFEAETLQRFLNGEELWSWPNGTIQLGQSFPDPAIINHLVREGLLDQNYQPTEAGRLAFQSWLKARSAPPPVLRTPAPKSDSL